MGYRVVNIPDDKHILKGIKLDNGVTCCYWSNKNNSNINKVVVIFNNRNAIDVKDNEICISLNGITKIDDMCYMLNAFSKETFSREISKLSKNVSFNLVVSNKEENIIASQLISKLRINATIVKSMEYANKEARNVGITTEPLETDKKEENLKKQDEILKRQDELNELNAGGKTDDIKTYNNGVLKKYSVTDGVIYDNNDLLSSAEKKKLLLEELMKDPVEYNKMINMSKEELDVYLSSIVNSNNKAYYLERAGNKDNLDARGHIATAAAAYKDGRVNNELGIVENSPSNNDKYSVTEENGNNYNLVAPEVTTSSINSSGGSQIDASSRAGGESFSSDNSNDTNITSENLSEREVEEVYYFDDYNNFIYNSSGEVVGKVGNDGYEIDWETNNLKRNGEVIGTIGDINDMGKDNSKSNSKVRVYKKETNSSMYKNNNDTKDQAAFISLPVIIFIISLFLLIGSGIILFLMK